jgi:hypothetical protein
MTNTLYDCPKDFFPKKKKKAQSRHILEKKNFWNSPYLEHGFL